MRARACRLPNTYRPGLLRNGKVEKSAEKVLTSVRAYGNIYPSTGKRSPRRRDSPDRAGVKADFTPHVS